MSTRAAWGRHYQQAWMERSGNRRLPSWLRVAALAYGSHKANGHAMFKPGEVALVLGAVDTVSGVVTPMNKHNVQRAIAKAVEFGWLAPDSGSLCLVVPGHAVTGGLGNPHATCPQHKRKRRVSQKVTHLGAEGESESDSPGESESDSPPHRLPAQTRTASISVYESSRPEREAG